MFHFKVEMWNFGALGQCLTAAATAGGAEQGARMAQVPDGRQPVRTAGISTLPPRPHSTRCMARPLTLLVRLEQARCREREREGGDEHDIPMAGVRTIPRRGVM